MIKLELKLAFVLCQLGSKSTYKVLLTIDFLSNVFSLLVCLYTVGMILSI